MDELENLILTHYKKYPHMQMADVFKLLYQNEFACGHMIADGQDSLGMILTEVAELSQDMREQDGVESIGNGLYRIYLQMLRQGLSAETLNRFFVLTANQPKGSAESFEKKVAVFRTLSERGCLPFDAVEIEQRMDTYRREGYPPMGHSQEYRLAYAPMYRVVDGIFCQFLPLFCYMDGRMKEKRPIICAIDGSCTSGKTTLAALLQSVYGCNVISMDDFFLQPDQRTPERLSKPGGNVDYQRFREEVLEPLQQGRSFAYRPYDCRTQQLGEEVWVEPHPLTIVEGVYSLHPSLFAAYDWKVFLDIDPGEQNRRLMQREKALQERFMQEWIPMENAYFQTFRVSAQCDMIFRASSGERGVWIP